MSAAAGLAGAHQATEGHARPHAASPPTTRSAALGPVEPVAPQGLRGDAGRPLARLSRPPSVARPNEGVLEPAWSSAVVPAEVDLFGAIGSAAIDPADLRMLLPQPPPTALASTAVRAVTPASAAPAAPAVPVAAATGAAGPAGESTTTGVPTNAALPVVQAGTPGLVLVTQELAPTPTPPLPGGLVLAPAPTPRVTPAVLGGVAPAHDPSTTTGEVVTVDDALLPPPPPPPEPPPTEPPPPPPPEPVPSDEQLAGLRACEAGGDYGAVSAGGHYRGAYQFDTGTWNSVAARWYPHLVGADPALVGPNEQDAMVRALYAERGWAPWPSCGWGL
jgi:hypothetical protein